MADLDQNDDNVTTILESRQFIEELCGLRVAWLWQLDEGWCLECADGRQLSISTRQLFAYKTFCARVFESLHCVLKTIPQREWQTSRPHFARLIRISKELEAAQELERLLRIKH